MCVLLFFLWDALQAAALITQRCFIAPMQLQFERVLSPFLLLHVNRYAGKRWCDQRLPLMT